MIIHTVLIAFLAAVAAKPSVASSLSSSTTSTGGHFKDTYLNQHRDLQTVPSYGSCGGCYCITAPNQTCPTRAPPTSFGTLPSIYLTIPTMNRNVSLTCNPYTNSSCDLNPPLQTGGACIVKFEGSCPNKRKYSYYTYPGTFEQAVKKGLTVTHSGPCGACSTLRDLAVYMNYGTSLSGAALQCGLLFAQNGTAAGQSCFEALGLTPACTQLWLFGAMATNQFCGQICREFVQSGEAPNGPPPNCTPAACLECGDTKVAPIFERFAGRDRRNSGLQTNFARRCDEITPITHVYPCNKAPKKGMGMKGGTNDRNRRLRFTNV